MASNLEVTEGTKRALAKTSHVDQTLLLFAELMEGGKEDHETCIILDRLTKLLDEEAGGVNKESICDLIDSDCVDTLVGYLDMRQPDVVRGHGTLTVSSYLKAAGDDGAKKLSEFFYGRLKRGTYDDYIAAFCVAAAVFPIMPELTSKLFLGEGFLPSLGPLMRRKWKSRKVETACLEMLNVACMNTACRDAVQKYCSDWLEEIVTQDPDDVVKDMFAANPDNSLGEGSISMRRHSRQVQNLAAVILAKLKATKDPRAPSEPPSSKSGDSGRVELAGTGMDDLCALFKTLLAKNKTEQETQNAVEGLAYLSLQPKVKEDLASDKTFLPSLIKVLNDAPPKSPLAYGGLSILNNLTKFQPVETEEEKRISQLKAYANAAGKVQPDVGNDDAHVTERCRRVLAADAVPVLVAHSKKGSVASLGVIVGTLYALSSLQKERGKMAQQGAVRVVLGAWKGLPETEETTRNLAAQTLARLLISVNPEHVFGGTNPMPMRDAVRPLASLIARDRVQTLRNKLPVFESLMALTNLASTDGELQMAIFRTCWDDVEELLFSSNAMITRAAVELVCNMTLLVDVVALYADGNDKKAADRLNIVVALTDSDDGPTRSAASGALTSLAGFRT